MRSPEQLLVTMPWEKHKLLSGFSQFKSGEMSVDRQTWQSFYQFCEYA